MTHSAKLNKGEDIRCKKRIARCKRLKHRKILPGTAPRHMIDFPYSFELQNMSIFGEFMP